mmetsp:Transcript_3959/g.12301  ORF Transcript_3959/g.12301 Transcript_3959/m.12301 type:complete len:138 (-) Transcript_3959:1518-1931(-)
MPDTMLPHENVSITALQSTHPRSRAERNSHKSYRTTVHNSLKLPSAQPRRGLVLLQARKSIERMHLLTSPGREPGRLAEMRPSKSRADAQIGNSALPIRATCTDDGMRRERSLRGRAVGGGARKAAIAAMSQNDSVM